MSQKIGNLISTIALGLLFVICLAFVGIRLSGLATFIVTGGSMEPTIQKGSLVLVQPVQPSEIALGDVITFQQYDQTTTHRVIAITRTAQGLAFKTQGDANSIADPEDKTFPGAVGVVRVTVPVAGYIIATTQSYWRLALTLLAAAIFFSCAGVLVFGSRTSTAALPKPVTRRLVRVTVDAEDTWLSHLAWLEGSRRRAAGLR